MKREEAIEFLSLVFEGLKERIKSENYTIIVKGLNSPLVVAVEEDYHRTFKHRRQVAYFIAKTPQGALVLVGLDYESTSEPCLRIVEIAKDSEAILDEIQKASNEKELSDLLPPLYDERYPFIAIEYTQLSSGAPFFFSEETQATEELIIRGTGFVDEWTLESSLTGEVHKAKGRRFLPLPDIPDRRRQLAAVLDLILWKLPRIEASLFEAREAGVLNPWLFEHQV